MPGYLTAVVAEALDPQAQAQFWAAALGWRQADTVVRPNLPDSPALVFVPAARPKTHKNRLHLDLAGAADPVAQKEAVQRLLDLGAAHADIGQRDTPWTVLADPEGNEFCVLREPGADGHLVAVCQDAADVAAQRPFWQAATGWSIADEGDWGVSLRLSGEDGELRGPRLVMGPPVTAKHGVNRWRFAVATDTGSGRGLTPDRLGVRHTDPEGNEFHLIGG